ncbi:MAG: HpcH/HpaI aldolase family protein [Rhodospirillales bacterium]
MTIQGEFMPALPQNRLKRALAAGQKQIGFWLTLASPNATEIAATAGFDWLLIDMEHSPNDFADIIHHLRAAEGGTAEPVVRIPWNEPVLVKRLLDIGVRSLMFPYVQTVDEAKRAVASTRYPPQGIRGIAGTTRATAYGRVKDYAGIAADEICVVVQAETTKALDAATDIAKVDGVDCIFIGPNDLSAGMGHIGNSAAPEVQRTIARGLANIKAGGKAPGILEFKEDAAKKYLAAGFQMIAVGGDGGMLARGTEAMAQSYKK